jgi:hypothetical protein
MTLQQLLAHQSTMTQLTIKFRADALFNDGRGYRFYEGELTDDEIEQLTQGLDNEEE